jgi:hypothetical protein
MAASGRPAVRVTDLTPFTVHGYRFDAGERLRLVITTKRRIERTLYASDRGTFVLKLRGLSVGRCGQYAVRVYDSSGLRARIKSPPQSCATPLSP